MNNIKDVIYNTLLNNESFYMRQYYSNFHKKEVFVAVKELKDGIYCVLISDDESDKIDSLEAVEYIKTLDKPFSFNIIILSSKDYMEDSHSSLTNKLVINKENYNIIKCDNSCMPLKHIFENISQKNESRSGEKGSYLRYNAVTLVIMGINILIFLLTALSSFSIFDIDIRVLVKYGTKVNILIEQGQIWRLLTCAFLHSGLIHIVCNMYSLYIIGPQIQQIYGTFKYLIIFIFSCITSSLLSYLMSPSISVGASGGISGLIGALLTFAIIERNRIQKNYIWSLLQIIILNVFIGLSMENIDNYGHLGGLIGGMITGFLSYKKKSLK